MTRLPLRYASMGGVWKSEWMDHAKPEVRFGPRKILESGFGALDGRKGKRVSIPRKGRSAPVRRRPAPGQSRAGTSESNRRGPGRIRNSADSPFPVGVLLLSLGWQFRDQTGVGGWRAARLLQGANEFRNQYSPVDPVCYPVRRRIAHEATTHLRLDAVVPSKSELRVPQLNASYRKQVSKSKKKKKGNRWR